MRARKPPEAWHLMERQKSLFLRAVEHYPDALGPLEVFDPGRRCAKCAGKAAVAWEPDRLKLTCRRCGYSWVALPLDSMPPENAETPAQPEG